MTHEDDKVRACAVFALHKQMSFNYGNTHMINSIKTVFSLLWNGDFQIKKNAYDFDDRNKDPGQLEAEAAQRREDTLKEFADALPMGDLTKLATGTHTFTLINQPF